MRNYIYRPVEAWWNHSFAIVVCRDESRSIFFLFFLPLSLSLRMDTTNWTAGGQTQQRGFQYHGIDNVFELHKTRPTGLIPLDLTYIIHGYVSAIPTHNNNIVFSLSLSFHFFFVFSFPCVIILLFGLFLSFYTAQGERGWCNIDCLITKYNHTFVLHRL